MPAKLLHLYITWVLYTQHIPKRAQNIPSPILFPNNIYLSDWPHHPPCCLGWETGHLPWLLPYSHVQAIANNTVRHWNMLWTALALVLAEISSLQIPHFKVRDETTMQDLEKRTGQPVLQTLAHLQTRESLEGCSAPPTSGVNHQITRDWGRNRKQPVWAEALAHISRPPAQGEACLKLRRDCHAISSEYLSPKTFPVSFLLSLILINLEGLNPDVSRWRKKLKVKVMKQKSPRAASLRQASANGWGGFYSEEVQWLWLARM